MIWLVLLWTSSVTSRQSDVTVDAIEFNQTDIDGSQISQVIFWKWSKSRERLEVSDYMMIDEDKLPSVSMVGDYYFVTVEGHLGEIVVRSKFLRHTKTDYDPERMNLKLLPYELRDCAVTTAMWRKYGKKNPIQRTLSKVFW